MSSVTEQRLSMEELKQRNRPATAWAPSQEDWNELTALLRDISKRPANLPDLHPNRGTDTFCAGAAADSRTGWEEEREILFSAETTPTRDTLQSSPVIRTARLIGTLGAVVQFGAALELLSVNTPVKDTTTIPHRIDRKRWKKLMEKK